MNRSQKLAVWSTMFFVLSASLLHAVTDEPTLIVLVIFTTSTVIAFLFMLWSRATERNETS